MARDSKSKYAILGILTLAPASGYDIKKYTEEIISHFWHESFGNLYTLLRRMLEQGLVSSRTEPQSGKPNRIVYSITEKGRHAFHAWLEQPAAHEILRSELLLKLFFGNQLTPDLLRGHLEAFRTWQLSILEILQAAQKELDSEQENAGLLFRKLTLRRGLIMGEARIRWADECLEALAEENHQNHEVTNVPTAGR